MPTDNVKSVDVCMRALHKAAMKWLSARSQKTINQILMKMALTATNSKLIENKNVSCVSILVNLL